MEMETINLNTLDSEQLEVYNYLVDTVGYDEDYTYRIVNHHEYTIHDDFESFIIDMFDYYGSNIPEFVEFDYIGMWLHTFSYLNGHYFIDNLEFKKRPNYIYKDEPEYKRWEFDFHETIKKSRFLEVHE